MPGACKALQDNRNLPEAGTSDAPASDPAPMAVASPSRVTAPKAKPKSAAARAAAAKRARAEALISPRAELLAEQIRTGAITGLEQLPEDGQAASPAWPPAGPARLRPRHRGVILSFVLVVLLPLFCAVTYLFAVAQDQFASTVGFTVRREEGAAGPSQVLGGLAQFAGVSGSSEADILYQFIQSQEVVALIDERIGLGDLYSPHWPNDPLMALWPDATIEELHRYWQRMVRISYDQSTQLLELRVLAFDPTDAQRIAQEIVLASQSRINDLNTRARADLMRYANEDLDTAVARLKAAREALSRFRTRTQIVDPAADIQGRMGVLNNLQQQLAQALIDNDLVLGTTQDGDPRRQQAARRIEVIRDRIAAERETFASTTETNIAGENYPALIAEFESLTVDLQFAEETYRAALAGVDVARANASRQSLYLAAYITPTLPQTAEYPQRFVLSGGIALFLLLLWSIGALIYYSARDRN